MHQTESDLARRDFIPAAHATFTVFHNLIFRWSTWAKCSPARKRLLSLEDEVENYARIIRQTPPITYPFLENSFGSKFCV
jgi:hypothetical protein